MKKDRKKQETRAAATKRIARTTDVGAIETYLGHQNKNVRRYAFHKLGGEAQVREVLGKLARVLSYAQSPGGAS